MVRMVVIVIIVMFVCVTMVMKFVIASYGHDACYG